MNIRNRMVTSVATTTATAGLLGAAAIHALWATGSTWPRSNSDDLTDLVAGRGPAPSKQACWVVAGLLAAAATAVASRGGRHAPAALAPLLRFGARAASAALLVRGAAGLVVTGARLADVTDEFRSHDLRLYSPLCLALGAGAAVAAA